MSFIGYAPIFGYNGSSSQPEGVKGEVRVAKNKLPAGADSSKTSYCARWASTRDCHVPQDLWVLVAGWGNCTG